MEPEANLEPEPQLDAEPQEKPELMVYGYKSVNEHPELISNAFEFVMYIFVNFGWYILGAVITFIYICSKIRPYIDDYLQKEADKEYAAKYHKNPDLYEARLLAMEESRRKMQEELNKKAEEYKIKLKKKEQRTREEFLAKHGHLGGHKLGSNSDDKPSNEEHFPLMSGGSSNYRAPKRSACGGGGCGK